MVELDIIKKNFSEFLEIANYSFKKEKYNSAVTLYYKALVELCDIVLYEKTGKIDANHKERFELLKQNAPELYSISSKLFRFYRDSYNKEISKTIAIQIKGRVIDAKTKYYN